MHVVSQRRALGQRMPASSGPDLSAGRGARRQTAAVPDAPIAERVLRLLRGRRPLDDDEIAHDLQVSPRQTINQDLLAFADFPVTHWREIWITNPLERLNREIKRRTDVVGVFPTHQRCSASPAPSSSRRMTNGPSPQTAFENSPG